MLQLSSNNAVLEAKCLFIHQETNVSLILIKSGYPFIAFKKLSKTIAKYLGVPIRNISFTLNDFVHSILMQEQPKQFDPRS